MKILIIPLIAGLIAQFSKLFTTKNKQKFSWSSLWAYSGMPSGHAALTTALTTIIGLEKGLTDPSLAISFVFTLLVLRDAAGLRQQIGSQGFILNELVNDLDDDDYLDKRYPRLIEKIGHTPLQILAGSILGISIGLAGYFLF